MESLHLSYSEAYEIIPYETMLLMQKDRIHNVSGDQIEYKTARSLGKKIE